MAKPAPFPHHYTVTLEDRRLVAPHEHRSPSVRLRSSAAATRCGAPRSYSSAPRSSACGRRSRPTRVTTELEFAGWRGTGSGVLDKGPTGPVFTSITLAVEMTVAAADVERARRVLDTAEKHCIISNALRVAVTLQDEIRPR